MHFYKTVEEPATLAACLPNPEDEVSYSKTMHFGPKRKFRARAIIKCTFLLF